MTPIFAALSVLVHSGAGAPSFDLRTLAPFWLTRTMHAESVLFVRDPATGEARCRLLFPPTRILAVAPAGGGASFEAGRDYDWRPGTGTLTLPPGSRIVAHAETELIRPAGSQQFALTRRDGRGEVLFGGSHEYLDLQTVVTYEHRGRWTGPRPTLAERELPRTLGLLRAGKPLAITLLGDSISTGCNASGWANAAPHQPAWQDLLVLRLREASRSEITLHNLAVGGMDTAWGLTQIEKVVETKPDLVLLAFGMNDSGSRPAADYAAKTAAMMQAVRARLPHVEFILVATMMGNSEWTYLKQELFPQYRDALAAMTGPGTALADLTGIWAGLLARKADRDMTGNGVNHPNDFGHRVYAMALSALLLRHPERFAPLR